MINKPTRTAEQIREHYEVERRLASKLKNASTEERRSHLNVFLHEELFRLIPHHPLLAKNRTPAEQKTMVAQHMRMLNNLLTKDQCFLEIGPGNCALSFEIAKHVKQVYAVDVNKTLTETLETPHNFKLFITDGCVIPVPPNSIDFAFSNQLMEHLHPDDAYDQLENIYKSLSPGGIYFCITPNKLNGPHDISRDFDTVATGFHLKEYNVTELSALFRKVGFSKIMMYTNFKWSYFKLPLFPAIFCEWVLESLPVKLGRNLARFRPISELINVSLIGVKDNR